MSSTSLADRRPSFACSEAHHLRARRVMPDGVSSPIRAFAEVAAPPLYIEAGAGATVSDADGNEYRDFILGLGPILLGHAHPAVVAAVSGQARRGTVFACPSAIECDLAETIMATIPFCDAMRFVCSGTEAAMTAVRLARRFTGRDRIIRFRGSYHGHADALLLGSSDHIRRDSEGSAAEAERAIVLGYGALEEVRDAFATHHGHIAAVIVEPVACNHGVVVPSTGFLTGLRELCDSSGSLLIFDETITAFRLSYGTVAGTANVHPDLIVFGKVIGGGLPIGAYAGTDRVMRLITRQGGVFQGGTFAGNPISVAAGLATLHELRASPPFNFLESLGVELERSFDGALGSLGRSLTRFTRIGSIASFMPQHADGTLDRALYSHVHTELLAEGFLLPPSAEEPFFLCAAHSFEDARGLGVAAARAVNDAAKRSLAA